MHAPTKPPPLCIPPPQARDEAGQWRLTGGDEFQVQLRGPAALAATVVDRGDGSYGVTYTATAAGVYQLCITIGKFNASGHT